MTGAARKTGPWHEGELALQRLVGSEPQLREMGGRLMRPFLTSQLQTFFAQLPFVAVAAVDAEDRPWVSLLEGAPGFVQAPDEHRLTLSATPPPGDPLAALFAQDASVGMLGIELHTRRRNRVNGLLRGSPGQWSLEVRHAFGNCPQYIHDWSAMQPAAAPAVEVREWRDVTLGGLPTPLLEHIDRAMTVFVGSHARTEAGLEVDASHRGGKRGFIRRDGDALFIPDFAGNRFFNTLGNILASGRAALLIPDFESGDVLHLTGDARPVSEQDIDARYPGAERYWRLVPRHAVWRPSALRWRSRVSGDAMETDTQGPWQALPAQRTQRVTVARVIRETPQISSFHLHGEGLGAFRAGQFITLRVPQLDGTPLMRSYTLSGDSRQPGYRISVKAQGVGSRYLHRYLEEGAVLDVSAPSGDFTSAAVSTPHADWVLLAGGIGITPLLSLAHELTNVDRGPVTLIQSARNVHEAPFGAELEALQARGLRLQRYATAAASPLPPGWQAGRVSLAQALAGRSLDETQLYLCGPAGFVERYRQDALDLGLPDARIHTEAFGPSSLGGTAPRGPAADHPVDVRFAGAQREGQWRPGETLLETAERMGLKPAYSCRVGICGQCACSLSQGQVTYDSALAVPAGKVLLCSAKPDAGAEALEIEL